MNDLIIDLNPKTPEQLASLRQITLVVYVLYALACTEMIGDSRKTAFKPAASAVEKLLVVSSLL